MRPTWWWDLRLRHQRFAHPRLRDHAAPGAVVGGFAQPPKLMFPPAIDDREAMYRITWDSIHNYGLFRPETAVVIFSAGYVSAAATRSWD